MEFMERISGILRGLQTIFTYFQMVLLNYREKRGRKKKQTIWTLLSLIFFLNSATQCRVVQLRHRHEPIKLHIGFCSSVYFYHLLKLPQQQICNCASSQEVLCSIYMQMKSNWFHSSFKNTTLGHRVNIKSTTLPNVFSGTN